MNKKHSLREILHNADIHTIEKISENNALYDDSARQRVYEKYLQKTAEKRDGTGAYSEVFTVERHNSRFALKMAGMTALCAVVTGGVILGFRNMKVPEPNNDSEPPIFFNETTVVTTVTSESGTKVTVKTTTAKSQEKTYTTAKTTETTKKIEASEKKNDITAITSTISETYTKKDETTISVMPVTTLSETNSAPTVATTTDSAKTISYEYSFLNSNNTELIKESFEVSFVRRKVIYSESGEKEYTGDEEVLETWDNAVSNPHQTAEYAYDTDYEYAVKADVLPEHMTIDYENHLYIPTLSYEDISGISEIKESYPIQLQKWEYDIPQFPISTNIEASVGVNAVDINFSLNISGLDITVFTLNDDMSEKDEIAHFISKYENKTIEVPLNFKNIDDKVILKFRINNMPEGYEFYQTEGGRETIKYFTCREFIDAVGKGRSEPFGFDLGILLNGNLNPESSEISLQIGY